MLHQFPFRRPHRWPLLLVIMVFAMLPAWLAAATCTNCRKTIAPGSRYLRQNDKTYCSQRCLDAARPVCAACSKPCRGGRIFVRDGRNYCSRACLGTTFPQCRSCGKRSAQGVLAKDAASENRFFCPKCAAGPRCFCCNLPGAADQLPDHRHICQECVRTAVSDHAAMVAVVNDVRRRMQEELDLGTDHQIRLSLVDEPTLHAAGSGRNPGRELGLYRHEKTVERTITRTTRGGKVVREISGETTSTEDNSILLLSHLSLAKMREVAAHELAHDWMQHRYPGITDDKTREGWAEYAASLVNGLYGQEAMNQRMAENTDPIYGEGYRWIRQVAAEQGRDGLFRLFADIERAGPQAAAR